jgi:diaminopimelate epimerase
MILRFSKMHGLGNDFMVVDLVTQQADLTKNQIKHWADRRTGIGFDQLLAVLPPSKPNADFRYKIFNRDGTEVEQCGNGARCFARFVRHNRLSAKTCLTLETLGGFIHTEFIDDSTVRVDMGEPIIDPDRIPIRVDRAQVVDCGYAIDVNHERVEFVAVSVGNPHAIIFVNDINTAPVTTIGPALQTSAVFPKSVNVGFLQIIDSGFARLRVFERGAGETLACGTGACAAMVAGNLRGHLGACAKISLTGGKLRLEWQGEKSPVKMTGPTTHIYEGQIRI